MTMECVSYSTHHCCTAMYSIVQLSVLLANAAMISARVPVATACGHRHIPVDIDGDVDEQEAVRGEVQTGAKSLPFGGGVVPHIDVFGDNVIGCELNGESIAHHSHHIRDAVFSVALLVWELS